MAQNNSNSLLNNIGANIQYFRKEAKLTQRDLALRAGLALNTVVKIENAKNNNISITTLADIAKVLNCDISQLTSEESNFKENPYKDDLLKQITEELKNTEAHFLRYIRKIIRETKKLQSEAARMSEIKR